MKIKILNYEFEIKAKFKGVDIPKWEKQGFPHNKFRITIKNIKTGRSIFFNFWDSYKNYEEGKKELNDEDLIYCFECFLNDALSYYDYQDINEFAKGFGYDLKEVKRVYNGCKIQYEKAKKLGLSDDDIINIFNKIVELENEDKLLTLVI
jgi:hypothetical protein